MARKKQTFDPHALTREVVSATHEVVTVPFRLRTYRVIRKILIIFIAVSIVNVVFANVFYTPKMYRILRENSELVFKYRLLQDKIRAEQRKLDEIHHRDNFVYRALFSADTLNIGGIYTPYPASKYAALAGDEYAPLMIGGARFVSLYLFTRAIPRGRTRRMPPPDRGAAQGCQGRTSAS